MMSDSNTIDGDKERVKMDLKTLVTFASTVIIASVTVCGYLYGIRSDMRQFHEDCVKNFQSSWQLRDQVERVHQLKENHGVEPEVSEVLRVTRPVSQQLQ